MVYLQHIYKNMNDNYSKDLATNIKSILTEIGEFTEFVVVIEAQNIFVYK